MHSTSWLTPGCIADWCLISPPQSGSSLGFSSSSSQTSCTQDQRLDMESIAAYCVQVYTREPRVPLKQSSQLDVCTWTALLFHSSQSQSHHRLTTVAMASIFTAMSMVVAECQIFLARPIPAQLMVMGVTREGASNLIFKLFPTRNLCW